MEDQYKTIYESIRIDRSSCRVVVCHHISVGSTEFRQCSIGMCCTYANNQIQQRQVFAQIVMPAAIKFASFHAPLSNGTFKLNLPHCWTSALPMFSVVSVTLQLRQVLFLSPGL